MRALLGTLLCVLLLQAQVFALSGGPDYNKGAVSVANIVGTYGGVMVENTDPVDGSNGGSVAVYTVDIAETGTSSGTMTVFNAGRVYPGTITGVGASTPDSSTFKGIIEASYNYTLTTFVTDPMTGVTTAVATDFTANTNGTLDTTIDTFTSGVYSNLVMSGTAVLTVTNGRIDSSGNPIVERTVEYSVSGYRQTAATTTAGV